MALVRITLDLAIPEEAWKAVPQETIKALSDAVKTFKALSVKINQGKVNEEVTVKAAYHICHHDEAGGVPCEAEVEI